MSLITAPLVQKAAAGDQDAITRLYELTYSPVYKALRALIQDEDTVLDILQDSYIKAFQSLDQLEAPENFLPWLRRIATNRAKDFLKKKKPTLFSEMANEEGEEPEFLDETAGHDPAAVMDRKETVRLMQEILGTLSEDQRMVIGMFYYQEMSVREIAETLGCPENTVKSRLNYGRKKVEAKVRELEKQGVKLYSLAPMPFLLWLFRQELAVAILPSTTMLQAITAQCATGAAAGAAAAGGAAATGSAAGGTAAAGTAAGSAAAAGTAVAAKVGAGILAAAVTLGGVAMVLKPEKPTIQEIREMTLQQNEQYMAWLLTADLEAEFGSMAADYLPGYEYYMEYQTGGGVEFYSAYYDINGDGLREMFHGADRGQGMEVVEFWVNVGTFSCMNPCGSDYVQLMKEMTVYTDGAIEMAGGRWFRLENCWLVPGEPSTGQPVELPWQVMEPRQKKADATAEWIKALPDFAEKWEGADYPFAQDFQRSGFYLSENPDQDWVLDCNDMADGSKYVILSSISQDRMITGTAQLREGKWVLPWEEGALYLDTGREGFITLTADTDQPFCQTYQMLFDPAMPQLPEME